MPYCCRHVCAILYAIAKTGWTTKRLTKSTAMTDEIRLSPEQSPVQSAAIDKLEIDRMKQEALSVLGDLWDQASDDGLNMECLSHAALFQALSSLVLVYGEENVAKFCSALPNKVLCGNYTLERSALQ